MYDYVNSTEIKQTNWKCTPLSSPGTGAVWFEEGSWGFGGGRGPFLSSCTGLPCGQQTHVTKETLPAWQKVTVNWCFIPTWGKNGCDQNKRWCSQWIKLLRTPQRKKTKQWSPPSVRPPLPPRLRRRRTPSCVSETRSAPVDSDPESKSRYIDQYARVMSQYQDWIDSKMYLTTLLTLNTEIWCIQSSVWLSDRPVCVCVESF